MDAAGEKDLSLPQEDEDEDRLIISDEPIDLNTLDVHVIDQPKNDFPELLEDDVEVLQ